MEGTNGTSGGKSEDSAQSRRFADDYTKVCALINESDPDAIRRAIRDNFEKCLLGSQYHMIFMLTIGLHRADEGVLQRLVRDFGQRLVSIGKRELIDWMNQADLDEMAERILAKASNAFLDKALVTRLQTIEARRLVNALARAERLGYDTDDIVESDEYVIPTAPGSASATPPIPSTHFVTATAHQQAAPHSHPSPSVSGQVGDLQNPQCTFCHRIFGAASAWGHVCSSSLLRDSFLAQDMFANSSQHLKQKVCLKPPATIGNSEQILACPHCGQSFGGVAGIQYHMLSKVCGDFGEITKEMVAAVKPMPRTAWRAGSVNELNRPTKRSAPDSTPVYISSSNNSPAPREMPSSMLQTPKAVPSSMNTARSEDLPLGTPRPKDMSHLTAHQIESLMGDLRRAEEDFKAKIDKAQASGESEDKIAKRLTSLRNSYACKQSTIRKKYGIKLRERRGRAEMDAERERMGYGAVARQETQGSEDKHADKRARVNDAGDATTTKTQGTPLKQVAVADIGSGLTGSNATAATEDPTASTSQAPRASQDETSRRPSSSYQQGNHRVEIHVPSPTKRRFVSAAADGTPISNLPPSKSPPKVSSGGTMTADELLRQIRGGNTDSSESDSDSDSSSDDDGDGKGQE
ncbi:uncharacterized protein CTRU02_208297 [Colletotrichum truncatum]|uniref:Uncharacterized protein n=1 Tax=Colletotrichum truncatum TaxID=5467 RepID=A0ACC3YWB4_COLTU